MQATFNIHREQSNRLHISQSRYPRAKFNFHSQIELFIVQEGEAVVWINEKRSRLKKGELAVALSYDAHSYQGDEKTSCRYLFIPTDLCGEFIAAVGNKRPKTPFIRDPKTFETVMHCLDEMERSENKLKTAGYLYLILGSLLEQMELEERPEPAEMDDNRILFYLNEHFKKPMTLQSIAEALGYNPSYLSRHFKARFHIGLNQYLTMLRLREAVLLMKERKNNIDFCAFESGFNSTRTFYRAFEKEFHCTPREYLKQLEK